ncbi:hypothetical protein ACWCPK_38530 [Streptomyces sp. NPDC001953]
MPVGGGFTACGCGGGSDCPSLTTPIASTGLCLPDGTPLAVVMERDCSGNVTQTGWLNLTTGAYTTGVPPTGTVACGDSRSITVSGVFCDVADDGTVHGLVLVEYHYADDGSIDSVRLVDAATGTTYTLQGQLTVCPSGGDDDESPGEAPAVRQVVERCGCDDSDGDGIGDIRYVELWSVDTTGGSPAFLIGTYIDGDFDQPYIPVNPVDCQDAGGDESPGEPTQTCAPQIVERCGCDDSDGDGIGDVRYTELWAIDPCGGDAPALLGAWVDGDFDQPYTPVAPVDCIGGDESPGELAAGFEVAPVPLCVIDDATGNVLQNVLAEVVYDQTTGDRTGVRYVDHVTGAPVPVPGGAHLAVCPVAESCNDCTTLVLCDVDAASPSTIAGTPASGRLANGVEWSAAGSAGAFPPSRQSDGAAWWNTALFPNPVTSPVTWTFDQSVTVDFSVVMVWLAAAAPGQNTAQVPVGSIPLAMPPGYSYDRTTGIVSIDATVTGCAQQNPTREAGARFRLSGVTSVTVHYLGTRAIVQECRVFGNYAFGAVDVSLGGEFLRTVCRDCDGTVTTVSDTLLDGETAYTPTGTVGVCMPATPDEPCPSTVQVLRLCDLNPDVDPDPDGNRCAMPFLRHLIYDCTGTVTSTLDTAMDGVTAYTPVQAVDCGTGGVPALMEVAWPQTGIAEDPALPGGQDFIYTVTNPDTGDAATVHLHATRAAGGSCGAYDPTAPVFNNPTNYTLDLTPEAQAMTRFRLDFNDLDNFEGVNALTPRPDRVEFVNGTGTYDPATGNIHTNEAANPGPTVYAYWNTPPATITWGYANNGGGVACTFVAFLGTTLKAGCCCSGCGGDSSPGEIEACGPVQTLALCDTTADGTIVPFLRTFAYDCDGTVAGVTDTELNGTTPYAVAGTVSQCEPVQCTETAICVRPSGNVEFISNAGNVTDGSVDPVWSWAQSPDATTWYDVYRVGVFPGWFTQDPGTAAGTAHWVAPHPNSGTLNTGLPGEGPTINASSPEWYARASFDLPSFADPATIRISATVLNADQLAVEWRLNGGPWQPVNRNHTAAPYTLPPTVVAGAQAGTNTLYVHVRETVFGSGGAGLMVHLIADYDVDATAYEPWTRIICPDGTTTYLDPHGETQTALPDDAVVVPCPPGDGGTGADVVDCEDGGRALLVKVCGPDESPGAEPCRDVSTTLLCDVAATTTITVFDPANVAGPDGWQVTSFTGANADAPVPAPMPYDAFHPAGNAYMGARADLSAGTGTVLWTDYDSAPVRWVLTKTITAPEDGMAVVQAAGFRGDGGARVRVNGVDVGLYGQWNQPAVGGSTQVPVTAGPNVIEIEVRDTAGPNGVTGRLDITMTSTQQFMRKQVTDCETGAVISTTDTMLDGQPYTVTGTVGQCEPVQQCCETPAPELRVDVETHVLCVFDTDGTVLSRVLAEYVYDDQSGDRTDTRLVDLTTGDPFTLPAGATLGECGAEDGEESPGETPCRNSSTLLVCDIPQDGAPTPTVTDTDPAPYFPDAVSVPVAGAQVLWDGGTLALPPGTGPQPGTPGAVNVLAATVTGARPACDDGTATVTASVLVEQTGPDDGCAQTGHLRLFNGTQQVALDAVPNNAPVGWSGTLTVTASVPAADLAAGNVAAAIAMDSYDVCAGNSRETGWDLSQFAASTVYDQAGCATQVLANVVTDCTTGDVASVTYTTLDGQLYTPTGEIRQCTTASPAPGQPCGDTEVATLCDLVYSPQAPIPTPAGDFTLTGNVVVPSDGASLWFAQANQVANGVAEMTVSGLLPSVMYEFHFESAFVGSGAPDPANNNAIYLLDILDGTNVIATRTRNLSNGSTAYPGSALAEDLPPLAFIAPATGAVTIRFTDQTTGGAINDRDLLVRPVDVRTASLTVTSTPFLRRFTFDCDGGLTSAQDLGLDGATPYVVQGEVGSCASSGDGSSVTAPTGDVVDCEDGSRALLVKVCDAGDESPGEPCGDTELVELCDLVYSPEPPFPTPMSAFALTGNVKVVGAGLYYSGGNAPTNGLATLPVTGLTGDTGYAFRFSTSWAGSGVPNPAASDAIYLVEILDGATVLASQQRNISNGTGAATGYVDETPLSFTAPASGAVTLRISDVSTGNGADRDLIVIPADVRSEALTVGSTAFLRAITFGCDGSVMSTHDLALDGVTPYTVAGEVATCTAGGDGTTTTAPGPDTEAVVLCDLPAAPDADPVPFLRLLTVTADGTVTSTDTALDGVTPYTVAGTVGVCPGAPDGPVKVVEKCRCDQTADGVAEYVELIAVAEDGTLTTIGTYDEEFAPYTPVSPVVCPVEGAPPAMGVQARRVELAPGDSWSAAGVTLLQSVTAVSHAGDGTVTTMDGDSTLHDGESVTWSVARDADAALTGPLTITAGTGTVTVAFTTAVTL